MCVFFYKLQLKKMDRDKIKIKKNTGLYKVCGKMMLIEWWSNMVAILTTVKVTVMESVREGVYNNVFLI